MELEVQNPNNLENLGDFCSFLIEQMQIFVEDSSNYDQKLADVWDNYFVSTDLGWPVDSTGNPVAPTFKRIVFLWFSSLEWFEAKGNYYIIPDDELLLNSTELTVDSLARMINFGVLGAAPYKFFDNVLDFFAEHLDELYLKWAGIDEE